MYTEDKVGISKADDGSFIVSVNTERKKKKGDENVVGHIENKIYTAKDAKDCISIIAKIISLIGGKSDEEEFDKAFKEENK